MAIPYVAFALHAAFVFPTEKINNILYFEFFITSRKSYLHCGLNKSYDIDAVAIRVGLFIYIGQILIISSHYLFLFKISK